MMKIFKYLKIFFVIALAGLVARCGSDNRFNSETKNVKIAIQLNWIQDPTFSGEYLAKEKGFWNKSSDVHLDVNIRPGGIGVDPLAMLLNGSAQFAVIGADKASAARSNGNKIKVVAVDFQRNPVGWIVRKSVGVNNLKDILNMPEAVLGDKVGTETSAILNVCLNRLNLKDKILVKGVGFDFSFFVQNENIVFPVYLNEEPVRARLDKIDIIEIDPSDVQNGSVKLYGNVIIAKESFVKENPEVVKSFVKGLRLGWEYCRDNEQESLVILSKIISYDEIALPEVFRRSVDYATSRYGQLVIPGSMEIECWEQTLTVLKEANLLDKDIAVSDLVWFGSEY